MSHRFIASRRQYKGRFEAVTVTDTKVVQRQMQRRHKGRCRGSDKDGTSWVLTASLILLVVHSGLLSPLCYRTVSRVAKATSKH